MIKAFNRLCKSSKSNNLGLSILECIIAILLISIALVSWASLTARSLRNGTFTRRLVDTEFLGMSKGSELIQNVDKILKTLPLEQTTAGSIKPGELVPGYFEQLNEAGCLITEAGIDCRNVTLNNDLLPTLATAKIPRYTRQWSLVKDFPNNGDVSIYVLVVYRDNSEVLRTYKFVKPGVTSVKAPKIGR